MICLEEINLESKKQGTALVTGAAGFIGFHISRRLLDEGWRVIGLDCISEYYDLSLKQQRENLLIQNSSYRSVHEKVETENVLLELFAQEKPEIVFHLAAQAGVRYSIDNPRLYLESNIGGTFELLEAARAFPPRHMLLASTSSAYGANENMPYKETDRSDHQMSFYAATKKSTENIAHSYSHLFKLPITMFRFFTVYGPWGRPDMALFRFVESILKDEPIQVFGGGEQTRDFTYIDDIVEGILRTLDTPATGDGNWDSSAPNPATSAAPWRVYNIGGARPIPLLQFISCIENCLDKKAVMEFLPMQPGDVRHTEANVQSLSEAVGYTPSTSIDVGIRRFIEWYRAYYQV